MISWNLPLFFTFLLMFNQIQIPRESLALPGYNRELMERTMYAVAAAAEAGMKMVELRSSGNLAPAKKSDGSSVTNADLFARDFFQKRLPRIYNCPILSEETGGRTVIPQGSPCWIVDELDGTASFLAGFHNFGPLVALHNGNELEIGVAGLPAMEQVFFAAKGAGAFRLDVKTGRVEAISTRSPGNQCFEVSGFFGAAQSEIPCVRAMLKTGAAELSYKPAGALHKYCLVASGESDAGGGTFLLNAWDIAAAVLIVREAGGEVFDIESGKPVVIDPKNKAPYRVLAVGKKESFAGTAEPC